MPEAQNKSMNHVYTYLFQLARYTYGKRNMFNTTPSSARRWTCCSKTRKTNQGEQVQRQDYQLEREHVVCYSLFYLHKCRLILLQMLSRYKNLIEHSPSCTSSFAPSTTSSSILCQPFQVQNSGQFPAFPGTMSTYKGTSHGAFVICICITIAA